MPPWLFPRHEVSYEGALSVVLCTLVWWQAHSLQHYFYGRGRHEEQEVVPLMYYCYWRVSVIVNSLQIWGSYFGGWMWQLASRRASCVWHLHWASFAEAASAQCWELCKGNGNGRKRALPWVEVLLLWSLKRRFVPLGPLGWKGGRRSSSGAKSNPGRWKTRCCSQALTKGLFPFHRCVPHLRRVAIRVACALPGAAEREHGRWPLRRGSDSGCCASHKLPKVSVLLWPFFFVYLLRFWWESVLTLFLVLDVSTLQAGSSREMPPCVLSPGATPSLAHAKWHFKCGKISGNNAAYLQ